MSDRAETPEQKRAVIERLLAVWLRTPQQRLGQLLDNVCSGSPFYVEDERLARLAESHYPEPQGAPLRCGCFRADDGAQCSRETDHAGRHVFVAR